jgi:RNA polymerase sigma-70 factor (ECF subfamily)
MEDPGALHERFLQALPDDRRQTFDRPELASSLERLFLEGKSVWPGLSVTVGELAAHIAAALPAQADFESLDSLFGADLFLACACAHGDAAALRELERHHIRSIDLYLARLNLEPDLLEEAKQLVRDKLLVGPRPRIADYSGRGELRSWLHATATRTALNLLRGRRRELRASDEQLFDLPSLNADPETQVLRERYLEDFTAAFREALASLTARQRVLLKRHFVDGLGTDGLGALYRVHRVTALRWLTQTRERLAARTHKALWRRLGLDRREFESVVRLVRSQLDFSIRSFLAVETNQGL